MKKVLIFLTILLSISSLVLAQDDKILFPYYKTLEQTGLCFIDKTGKVVFEVPHKFVNSPYQHTTLPSQLKNNFFYEGYCLLNVDDNDTQSFLLIYNTKGELVKKMPNVYGYSNFHEGYAIVFVEDKGKCYTMNKKFELEKELPFKRMIFNEQGIGIVYQNQERTQVKYYNTRGESLSDRVFEYAPDDFKQGVLSVKAGEKQIFLNKKLENIAVTTPQEMINKPYIAPTDGAVVLFNNVGGDAKGISRIVDNTGKEMVIKTELKALLTVYVGDGLFVKREGYKCSFVTANGTQVMPLAFYWDESSKYENGLAWVRVWEDVPIPKRIVRQLVNVKAGKVLLEYKIAPCVVGCEVDFAFFGELTRVGCQYFDRNGKAVFTLPANSVKIKQWADYMLYAPEDIKYFEPDSYDVANERYVAWEQFKDIGKVNPITLYLRDWKFKEFPKEVLNMTNLEDLSLLSTEITTIPTEIDKLKKLKTLNLENNKIKRLPESLANLPLLTQVRMSENPYERNLNLSSISFDVQSIPRLIGMTAYDGEGNAYSGKKMEEREEAKRKMMEDKYRLPDELPILSNKGANLILWVLQNPPKRDTTTIFREFEEANEMVNERIYEGQVMRRDIALIYPLALKRRQEIWAILKEKEKQEIERRKQKPDGRWGADVSTAVFYSYTSEKVFIRNKIVLEEAFFKDFNNVAVLKEKLPAEKSIRGFNLVKMVEEQLQQNVSEDAIKKNIREFLDKEFGAFLHR